MSNTVERLYSPHESQYPVGYTPGASRDKSHVIVAYKDRRIELWHESPDGMTSSCITVQLTPLAWAQLTEFMQEVGE